MTCKDQSSIMWPWSFEPAFYIMPDVGKLSELFVHEKNILINELGSSFECPSDKLYLVNSCNICNKFNFQQVSKKNKMKLLSFNII